MLKIRLARVGKKNYATFRVIVSDHTKSPKAKALEILGSFDPNTEPAALKINEARIKYWLSKGVGCSDTARDLLVKQGLVKKVDRVKYTPTNPKKSKAQIEKDKAAAAEKAKAAKSAPAPSQAEGPKAEAKPAEVKKEGTPKEAPKPATKK